MKNNSYQQLEQKLLKNYQLEKIIKDKEGCRTFLVCRRGTHKKAIAKYFKGDAGSYYRLLNISSDNLPKVYEVMSDGQQNIVLEEYIEGVTLNDVLKDGYCKTREVRDIVLQVCKAAAFLHENSIIHRDIKPDNIMMNKQGVVKLIDYDVARIYKPEQSKDTNNLGTIGYAAPEQYGFMQTDHRADIYAIGVLINVLLTGEHPSKQFCPGRYRNIVRKCTQINPQDRYSSVKELMKKL